MTEIIIRQNYENYTRVKEAFKNFIHALVWESMDIDDCVEGDEVDEHIDMYCKANGDKMIEKANNSVTKYINSLNARYTLTCYEIIDGVKKAINTIHTDNVEVAFKKAANFYRLNTNPYVEIFDREESKYIAKWKL
jgi:hypothetical protein